MEEGKVGSVIPGSGRRGEPRRLAHIVSTKVDGETIGKLRIIARERNVTINDLLMEGARLVIDEHK